MKFNETLRGLCVYQRRVSLYVLFLPSSSYRVRRRISSSPTHSGHYCVIVAIVCYRLVNILVADGDDSLCEEGDILVLECGCNEALAPRPRPHALQEFVFLLCWGRERKTGGRWEKRRGITVGSRGG